MAQRKKSEVEFIQDTFCPQVAVLCSYDAEVVCRKNALTFVELVQPFCRFNGEIKISDSSNNLCTISNLRVEIKDINSLPPQPLLAKKLLDEAVANGLQSPQNCIEKRVSTNNYNFVANVNTPWFESWRECFIKVGYPDDHEFLKHFLACIFVVSTSHLDPLDQFQKLVLEQQQPVVSNRLPKWFFPSQNYKYFVLLHDVQEGEISKAHQVYENLKSTYGSSNCHLLQINSKSNQQIEQQKLNNQTTDFDPWLKYCKFNSLFDGSNQYSQKSDTPEVFRANSIDDESIIDNPLNSKNKNITSTETVVNGNVTKRHGMCLAMSDHDRIKTLISEFLQRGLVPYTERTIKMLNEQIQSKKSILKSFGIPRRIFGGSSTSISSSRNSSSSASLSINSTNNSSTASLNTSGSSSPAANCATTEELQLRRLADLSFMFRLYDLAYNSYHTCKKEFTSNINNTSQQSTEVLLAKTLYLAGALEMASLSNFMQNFSGIDQNPSSSSLNSSIINSSKTYNLQYIDEAILLLLNTCKNNYFATRCALLSTEALKANNLFVKAAYQFISLSSDESDMRSALFLEQAAQCYLAMNMIRKYAFFMSIAGYRFNKAGQRKHSIRVYKHSLDIYENRNWFKAQDHLNFVMSRLNYNLKNLSNALIHINNITNKKKLPQKPSTYNNNSESTPFTKIFEFQNETNVLKDLILYCNTKRSLTGPDEPITLPALSVPYINAQNIKINLLPVDNVNLKLGKYLCINENYSDYLYEPVSFVEKEIMNSLNNIPQKPSIDLKQSNEIKEMWTRYEQALYMSAYKSQVPLMFKPQVTLLGNNTDNKQVPKVYVNETLIVMFEMQNILKISTVVYEATLLWRFEAADGLIVTNEVTNESSNEVVECSMLSELTLTPFETYKIRFSALPKRSNGVLTVLGLKYRIGLPSQLANSTNSLSVSVSSKAMNESTASDYSTLIGKQLFEIKGKRLNNNQQNIRTIAYDVDNRLNFKIVEETARLQIEMDKLPEKMLCNQLELVRLYFINNSNTIPVGNIRIASNGISQSNICFDDPNKQVKTSLSPNELNTRPISDYKTNLKPKNDFESKKAEPLKFSFTHTHKSEESYSAPNANSLNDGNDLIYSLDNVVIAPNEHYTIDMWIKAPETEGTHPIYFMFFYEDSNNIKLPIKKARSNNDLKYRTIKYELALNIEQSLTSTNTNIINSQIDSNLILNLEIAYHQHLYNFEFVDLISVSNIWQAKPIEANKKTKNISNNNNITQSKSDDVLSLILKAQPIKKTSPKEVYFYRSIFKNINVIEQTVKPKENVLFHFIHADLRSQLEYDTKPSHMNYLTINILWRSVSKNTESTGTNVSYGIMPLKVINEQESCPIPQEPGLLDRSAILDPSNSVCNSTRDLKKLILITANCKSNVQVDFINGNFSSVQVEVHLKNITSDIDCDLILIAKNPRNFEIEKNYLWLGCNKKYTKLAKNSSKTIKFKLGFYSTGTFEIGRVSADTALKASIFEASCNLNTSTQNTISLNEFLNEVQSDTISGNSLNPVSQSSQTNETSALSVFIRNASNNKYELFKRLNPFTVSISSR